MTGLWLAAGLLVAGTLTAAITWWARGFLHHALRQARGRKQAPQPWRAYGQAVVSEARATLGLLVNRVATWYQDPPQASYDPDGGPPILLVPDPVGGWAWMIQLSRLLREHGFTNVHLVDTENASATVQEQGSLVHDRLSELTREADSLAIGIAHGTGGLALRWAIDEAEASLLAHAILIGTPHAGTRRPAYRGMDRSQVAPGSTVVGQLDEAPLVPCTSVFSHLDDRVAPARSARWGDQAIAVPGLGHRGLVYEARSTRMVLAVLVSSLAEGAQSLGEG